MRCWLAGENVLNLALATWMPTFYFSALRPNQCSLSVSSFLSTDARQRGFPSASKNAGVLRSHERPPLIWRRVGQRRNVVRTDDLQRHLQHSSNAPATNPSCVLRARLSPDHARVRQHDLQWRNAEQRRPLQPRSVQPAWRRLQRLAVPHGSRQSRVQDEPVRSWPGQGIQADSCAARSVLVFTLAWQHATNSSMLLQQQHRLRRSASTESERLDAAYQQCIQGRRRRRWRQLGRTDLPAAAFFSVPFTGQYKPCKRVFDRTVGRRKKLHRNLQRQQLKNPYRI